MSENRESEEPFRIELAPRVHRLPPYLFGRINALMYEKRRAGADVIDLGMGNPSDPPEALVIEKLAEAARDPRNHGYSPSAGIIGLRREVASKYLRVYGVRLDPESEVITCLGSKEGFSHMCLALMGPGDTAIVPSPSYPAHVYGVALAAGNVISLEVADTDKFLSNVAYTCQHLYPRPKLLIVNFPHNPSAVTVEKDFFEKVVKLARQYGFMVISDFAYADVSYEGYKPPSFLAAPGASEVGVEFTTMSKGYNMAGWRIGFCAGNAQMIKALATTKSYYDYGMFRPIQIAAIMALRQTDAAVEHQSEIYQRRRDVLCNGLSRLGWDITVPRASMFVWAKMPEEWTQRLGSIDFAMKLLEEGDVVVSPGAGFGPAGEGYLRLALVENEERLRQAVRQIGRCLEGDSTPASSGTEDQPASGKAVG
jgi:alanine-synthesizing transaminase